MYVISEEQLRETLGALSAAGILLGTTPDGVIATTHKMLEGVRTNPLSSALKAERERVLDIICLNDCATRTIECATCLIESLRGES